MELNLEKQVKPRRKLNRNQIRESLWGYAFVSPNFIIMLIFTIIPIFYSAYVSMTDWNLLSDPEFIGLENYSHIFEDKVARETFINTFYFTIVSVVLNVGLTLLFAVLLNEKIRGIKFFRTAFYLPYISASVAISLMFMWLLSSNGLVNQLLEVVGMDPVPWLTDKGIALNSVIGVTIWRGMGMNIVIFLAALQDVPHELLEAAEIDGASRIQRFFKVIVPLLSPVIFFVTITGVIGSFQAFDLVYNMTQGGPGHATTLIGYYIWRQAFDYLKMGYGAALANIVFGVILVLTLIQWVLRKRWVYNEE